MKKTYKNMWGASLLASLLLMAMGGAEAEAASTTFEFSGPTEAFESLEVWYQYTDDISSQIVDKKLIVEFEGQANYDFSILDTYKMTIEAPAGLTDMVDYRIIDYGSNYGYYSVSVLLTDACDGTVFKVTIPGGEEEEPTEMGPASLLLPLVDENYEVSEVEFGSSVIITYDFQALTMLSEMYVPATIVNPAGDGFSVAGMLTPLDPSIAGDRFDSEEIPEGNVVVSFNIANAAMPGYPMDFDVLLGTYFITIPAGVVANEAGQTNPEQTIKFTVTENNIAPTRVTFEFSGDVDGLETLMIADYGSYQYLQDQIEDYKLTVSFDYGYNMYQFTVDGEYELEINPPASLVENEDYVLYPGVLDSNMGVYGVVLELTSGADGSTFNVNVYPSMFNKVNEVGDNHSEGNIVYTLTGTEVMRTATREGIKNLVPGLYIVNGKKVMIRK